MTHSQSSFLHLIAGRWLDAVLALLATFALLATPLQALRLTTQLPTALSFAISCAFACTCLGLIARHSVSLADSLRRISISLSRPPLWSIALLGLALRVIWIALFPAEAASDGKVYLDLGLRLSEGQEYENAGTRAYWPIGYALFLAAWLKLPIDSTYAYLLANLFSYLLGVFGVAFLARTLAGDQAARIAALLFAIWPNLIFNSATPEKEMLVLALLPWATAFLLGSTHDNASRWLTLPAGLLMGAATLVQPSLQFIPLVGAVFLLGIGGVSGRRLASAALLIASAALVIAPWSIRNYQLFDQFVLVSTNGGDVLYRANNPIATGGYQPRGEIDLSQLDEIERDKLGRRYAFEWIRTNPAAFAALVAEKQVLFMGDDAVGVYTTLKVGKASTDGRLYALLKAASNAWWLLVWACLLAFSLASLRRPRLMPALGRAPIWLWLYLFAIHSLFESTGKYHVPVISVLCVLVAVFATAPKPDAGNTLDASRGR
jgi:hypothetical protein